MTGANSPRLKSFIDRIMRLEKEKDDLAKDIREVYTEAKGLGYDAGALREIVREKKKIEKKGKALVDEQKALVDIYKAELGMLDGTPLGNAAIQRLTQQHQPKPTASAEQYDLEEAVQRATPPVPVADDPPPEEEEITLERAREMGRAAARAGQPVTANPMPARDPNRAAWDEGWCEESGSDGMDLPAAWQRSKPQKPAKPEEQAPQDDAAAGPEQPTNEDDEDKDES